MKKNLYNYSEFNLENIDNNSFIYVYLDPRRTGEYKYGEYKFQNEPFYVGVSMIGKINLKKEKKILNIFLKILRKIKINFHKK
jgi:hypothetical protein